MNKKIPMICINNSLMEPFLTIGETYDCLVKSNGFVSACNDKGSEVDLWKHRFIDNLSDNSIANHVANLVCKELE